MKKLLLLLLFILIGCSEPGEPVKIYHDNGQLKEEVTFKEVISTFNKDLPSFPIDEIILNGINRVLSDNGNKKNEFGDTCGYEFEKPRTYHFLDINNDGKDDLLIFMTIEGLGCGNDYSFFLLTSFNENGKYNYNNITKIGGKGSRNIDFEFLSVKGDSLYFQSIEYGPNDGMCCPSLENKISIPLDNFYED